MWSNSSWCDEVIVLFVQNAGTTTEKLQLRMSLYDSQYRQFFGQTWIGPAIDSKSGSKLAYNQVRWLQLMLLIMSSTHMFELLYVTVNYQICQQSTVNYDVAHYIVLQPDI